MKARASVPYLVPAIAAVGLILLHIAGRGPDPVGAGSAAVLERAPAADRPSGAEVDEQMREEWKREQEPSVLDTGEDRETRELYMRMKTLGTTPIEIVGRESPSADGLIVGTDRVDLERFLAAGGHYCGPLPTEEAHQHSESER